MTKEILDRLRAIEARLENPVPPKAYLSTKEAAAYTSIGTATFEEWRSKGTGGPRFVKLQAKVLYRVEDLDAFMAERLVEVRA